MWIRSKKVKARIKELKEGTRLIKEYSKVYKDKAENLERQLEHAQHELSSAFNLARKAAEQELLADIKRLRELVKLQAATIQMLEARLSLRREEEGS